MQKVFAQFLFEAYKNSYSVEVTNLDKLSVEQIREIEEFVAFRKGIFNFETFTFSIQKRLDFESFQKLISSLGIKAICKEKEKFFKQEQRINFGQYKGLFYYELPDSYMLWLKNNYHGYDREKVEKELQKRNL